MSTRRSTRLDPLPARVGGDRRRYRFDEGHGDTLVLKVVTDVGLTDGNHLMSLFDGLREFQKRPRQIFRVRFTEDNASARCPYDVRNFPRV